MASLKDERFVRKIGDTNSTFKMHELLCDIGLMGKKVKAYFGAARALVTLNENEFTIVEKQFTTQAIDVPYKKDDIVRTYNVVIKNTNGGNFVVEGYDDAELFELEAWGSTSTTEGVPCLLTITTGYDK